MLGRLGGLTRTLVVVFAVACGDDGAPAAPVDTEPGPSTGSTCPSEQTLTYENFGRNFLESYCTRCHSNNPEDGNRHGAPMGLNWDEIETVREYALRIDKMAAAGPKATNMFMPPTEPPEPEPTLAERRELGEWLVCGAP